MYQAGQELKMSEEMRLDECLAMNRFCRLHHQISYIKSDRRGDFTMHSSQGTYNGKYKEDYGKNLPKSPSVFLLTHTRIILLYNDSLTEKSHSPPGERKP